MAYNLNEKDVFCYVKVMNVVCSLDVRINMLLLSQIDVDQDLLCYLDTKRTNYRKLMREQNKILCSSKKNLHYQIISEKLLHHTDSVKSLCQKVQQSDNVVGWHLRKYENKMKKYLV